MMTHTSGHVGPRLRCLPPPRLHRCLGSRGVLSGLPVALAPIVMTWYELYMVPARRCVQ